MNRGNPVVGIIFIIIGFIFLTILFIKPALKNMEAKSWQKTVCTVINSNIKAGYKGSYDVNIIYTYDIGGVKYTGNRYNITGDFIRETAKAVSERYPEGTKTFCYVNPKNHSEAVIETELGFGIFGRSVIVLIWTLFAIFITIANLKSRKAEKKQPVIKVDLIKKQKKKEKKKKKKEPLTITLPQKEKKTFYIPALMMFIPGFIITAILSLPLLMSINRVKTPCVILSSEVKPALRDAYFQINNNDITILKNQFSNDKIKTIESIKYSKFSREELKNTLTKLNFTKDEIKNITEKIIKNFHYMPCVVYKYNVNAIEYTSDRYSIYSTSWKNYQAEKLISLYPPGKESFCYVKIAHPEDVYLSQGITYPLNRIFLISLILMIIGGIWLFKDKIKMIKDYTLNVFRR
jgi:hypothetical protein